jgi:hypothetical protein
MKILKKSLVFYFFTYFILSSFVLMGTDSYPFSVDRLYPENWYTKACDYCTQAWGIFEDLVQHKKNGVPVNYLIDASIGQLTIAKYCLHNMMNQKLIICHDDLIHLSRIIGTLEDRYKKLSQTIKTDKTDFLYQRIAKLRKKMEFLLQPNNSYTSSCQ